MMSESNWDRYMKVMDELSSALQDDEEGRLLLDAARMIVAVAMGQSQSCPFRPSVLCGAMLAVERLNAKCDGSRGRVSDALFHDWLHADSTLLQGLCVDVNGIKALPFDKVALLGVAHQLVDLALNTCSDNPNHVSIMEANLSYLDASVGATAEVAA